MSSIAPTTFKCAPCQLFFMSADDLVTHQRREDCLRLAVMQMSQEEEEHLPNVSTLEEDAGSAASATTAMSIEGISDGPYSAQSSAGSAPIDDTDMTDAYVTSGDDQQNWENASIFEHFDTDYEYSNIQEFGISLIKLLDQNGVSREVQRKLVKHINGNLLSKFESNAVVQALGGFLPSQESIHALISKGTQTLSKNYHVCPSGCKLYSAETAYPILCEHCSSPRYKNHSQALSLSAQSVDLDADNAPVLQPQQILSMASVASALGELLLDDQFREDIKYKHQFDDPGNDSDALQDIFSGSVYRDLRDQGVVQKNDLCLLIMVDGFQNKLSPKNSSALVHCMVMNASPDKRYQTKSMISLSVIGGPGKPKDIMSFLKPILDEIHLLNQNGLCVKKNDRVVYTGFVHLLGCTGDIPGIAELMGHHGHASFFGCRMCQVQGVHPQGSVNGMYFPGTGAGRTIEELKNGDPDRNLNAVDALFCRLDTFTGVEFFLGDEMHLLGQGLSKLLFNMLNPRTADNFLPLTPPSPSSSLSSESQPPFYPFRMFNSSPNHLKTAIGDLISKSKRTIPLTFDGCWDPNFGYYRSVDYLDFLLFVTPTIIVDKLVDTRARNALMALINGCSLALQWSITKAEIDQMDSDFKIWHDYLRSEIAAGQLSERVFTINNHYLSHLKQLVIKMGPLRSYSCRPMERTIKMFTNLITSTSNPAVNASNVFRRYLDYKRFAIQTIDLKHFLAKEFDPNSYRIHPDNNTNNHSFGELWEPFKLDTLNPLASRSSERQVCFGLKQAKVINAFVRYYSRVRGRALMVSDINWGAVELASAVEKDGIVHGSLMDRKLRHLKTRSNAAVLFKAVRKVGQRSVDVWLVAVVQCYLTHEQDGETRFLAVGEVMKKHEFDVNNVITVTKNASGPEAQKIAVFSTEDILENVGLVQYSQNSYKFKVIWPYMCFYKGAGPLEIGRLTDV